VGEVYSIADKPPFVFHAFGNSRFCVMAEFVDFGFWEFGNLGFSIFQFAGFLLYVFFLLSGFQVSRNLGCRIFRFTEIRVFGAPGLAAVLVFWISGIQASCFSGFLGFGFSACLGFGVSYFEGFRCSLLSFVLFPFCF
jgi:hypothetical protein